MALRGWLLLLSAAMATGFPGLAAAQDVPGTVPLNLFSHARGDNFTTAIKDGERDAQAADYVYVPDGV